MVVDISEARKLLQEICPERITDNSLIWTLLLSQASGLDASERKTAPAVDYFSSIDFFQGPNTTKASLDLEHDDAAAVPERVSVASISGLNQEPVTTGEADRHSDAATLSEWGLDRLFDGNESSSQQGCLPYWHRHCAERQHHQLEVRVVDQDVCSQATNP